MCSLENKKKKMGWLETLILKKQKTFETFYLKNNSKETNEGKEGKETKEGNSNNDLNSRYKKEFKELTVVGWGGGGEVWMVIHKLDGRIYAVKKILLSSKDIQLNKKIKREVTTISRLLHINVVRYYASWVEEVLSIDNNLYKDNDEDNIWSSNSNSDSDSDSSNEITNTNGISITDSLYYHPNNNNNNDIDLEFVDESNVHNGGETKQSLSLSSSSISSSSSSSYASSYITSSSPSPPSSSIKLMDISISP